MKTFKDAKGKYGRYLGKILLDEEDYGSLMIAAGYAKPYFGGKREK